MLAREPRLGTRGHVRAGQGVRAWLPSLPPTAHLGALPSSGAVTPPPALGTAAATAEAAGAS